MHFLWVLRDRFPNFSLIKSRLASFFTFSQIIPLAGEGNVSCQHETFREFRKQPEEVILLAGQRLLPATFQVCKICTPESSFMAAAPACWAEFQSCKFARSS